MEPDPPIALQPEGSGMTAKAEALAVLARHAGEWVTAQELIDAGAGYRFGARLDDLRRDGHAIESKRGKRGWLYRLRVSGQTELWEAASKSAEKAVRGFASESFRFSARPY